MRTQIWIIAAAFAIFGVIAMLLTSFSPAYVALIIMGAVGFAIGAFIPK